MNASLAAPLREQPPGDEIANSISRDLGLIAVIIGFFRQRMYTGQYVHGYRTKSAHIRVSAEVNRHDGKSG